MANVHSFRIVCGFCRISVFFSIVAGGSVYPGAHVRRMAAMVRPPQSYRANPVLFSSKFNNPGIKLRLTQQALNYINDLAIASLEDQLPQLRIRDFTRPNNRGYLSFKELRLFGIKPPRESRINLYDPNRIVWSLSDMNINLKTQIKGRVRLLLEHDIQGLLVAKAEGIDVELANIVGATAAGQPTIQNVNCRATTRKFDMTIHNAGLVGAIVNLFKGIAIQEMQPGLMREVCTMAERMINNQANRRLQTMPLQIPLSSEGVDFAPGFSGASSIGGESSFTISDITSLLLQSEASTRLGQEPKDGLWLDYRLSSPPRVQRAYLETQNQGEVRWRGVASTPFHAERMIEPLFIPSRMVYMLASDFLPNSLMYHGYINGLMRFEVTPDNENFAGFLETSCFDGLFDVCIGDVIPVLGETHPNTQAELLFYPTRAPTFVFTDEGFVELDAEGNLFVFIPGERSRQQILSATVTVQANTNMTIQNNRVIGALDMKKFKIKLLRTSLPNLDEQRLDELGQFVGSILEIVGNGVLQKGLPLPEMRGIRLVDPRIEIFDRFIRIGTDLEIDQGLLNMLAAEAIQRGFSNFGS